MSFVGNVFFGDILSWGIYVYIIGCILGLILCLSFNLNKKNIFFLILYTSIVVLILWLGHFLGLAGALYTFDVETNFDMMFSFNFHTETTKYSFYFSVLILLSVIIILTSLGTKIYNNRNVMLEFPIISLLMTFFLLCLIDACDFFVSFVCIVGFSLNVYVLILSNAVNQKCCEAAIKYFYLSSIASGLLAFSLWLNYLTFFSLNFIIIEDTFKEWDVCFDNAQSIVNITTYFLCYGLFFKLAAFPCHFWAASVYEGSPLPVMAFFVLPIKTAILAFVFKIFYTVLKDIYSIYVYIFWFSSFFSLIFGGLAALVEKKIKKFFAYSSINQMGFLLMGVVGGNSLTLQASVLYLTIYVITNLALFIILLNTFDRITNRTLTYITDLTSFATTHFNTALTLTVILFSMAGIPPLVGFFGKYYLFLAMYDSKFYLLVVTALITSLWSAYYYLRLIKSMLFEVGRTNNTSFNFQISNAMQVILFILVVSVLCFFDIFLEISALFSAVSLQ